MADLHLIYEAVLSGNLEVVKNLVTNKNIDLDHIYKRKLRYIYKYKNGGYTLIHIALFSSNLECVSFLLSSGANPNIKTSDGWTPLHFAVKIQKSYEKGWTVYKSKDLANNKKIFGEQIRALLRDPRTDLNIKDNCGNTPLQLASKKSKKNKNYAKVFEAEILNRDILSGNWTPRLHSLGLGTGVSRRAIFTLLVLYVEYDEESNLSRSSFPFYILPLEMIYEVIKHIAKSGVPKSKLE